MPDPALAWPSHEDPVLLLVPNTVGTLTPAVMLTGMGDGLPLSAGRHHFFDARSFSTTLSNIASARSFFSFAFSSSSAQAPGLGHLQPTIL